MLDHCEAKGIGFIPWYPLAGRQLAEPGGPLATAAEDHGITPGAVALAWLLHRSPGHVADPRHEPGRPPRGEHGRRPRSS